MGGLKALIESYQDNPVMHPDVPAECKPLVIENGKVAQLAMPDRPIRRPRLKTTTPLVELDYLGHDTTNACVNIEHRHLTSAVSTCQDITDTTWGSYDSAGSTRESQDGSCARSDRSSSKMTADGSSEGDSDCGEVTPIESSVVWMPDEAAHSCCKCSKSFTFLRRRHHCRGCGRIFCAECAPRTGTEHKRLCGDCGDVWSVECVLGSDTSCVRPQKEASLGLNDKPLVVQNTFITLPRGETTEDLFQ